MQRSEFWKEHAWTISEAPYDKPEEDGSIQRRRSLDYITQALGHHQKELKFLKSDLEGREWILLRQVISHIKLLDVRQVSQSVSQSVLVTGRQRIVLEYLNL